MVAVNVRRKKYRWELPYDPSAPPMIPETAAPPSFQYTPPAGFVQPPALGDMPPITAEDVMAPQPETAYPQASPEMLSAAQDVVSTGIPPELDWQAQQQQQLEQMRQEAEELREMEKETERLKKSTALLKAQNAMDKAQEDKAKLTAPREEGVRAGVQRLKEKARRPSGREALSWRGGDRVTGRPASQGLQEYIIHGGTVPELRGIRQRAAEEQVLKEYAPQFVARPTTVSRAPEITALHEAHKERMAPILAEIADIGEAKRELRRRRKPPTQWAIMAHKERVARIAAGPPELPKKEEPRYARGHQIGVLENEILELEAELAEMDKQEPSIWTWDKYNRGEWQTARDEIVARLNTLKAERRKIAGLTSGTQEFIATATNPETGQKLGFDGKQWLPIP